MLYVEKWAKGRPKLLAISAIQLVTFSDFLYETIPQAKERRLFGRQFPLPDLVSWYGLYQTPLKPIIAFVTMIMEFSEKDQQIIAIIFAARKLHKMLKRNPNYFRENPPSPEDLQEGKKILNQIFDQIISEVNDELNPQPVDPVEKAKINKYLEDNEQELGFFFFLFVPSLLIYQTSPNLLYRKAVSGDIDSIEKLLKLDPLMLHETAVGHQIQKLRFASKTNDYERIKAAVDKLAVTDYSNIDDARKGWKVELAAIISALSKFAGKRYSTTQITKLFDAYAKDKHGVEIDTDLPVGSSFYKAIDRHIQPWHDLFQNPDTNK